jgi:hypothetical protein
MTHINCSYKCISHFTCFDINLNWTWHIWTVPTNFKIIRRLKEMESENWVEGPRRSVYFFFFIFMERTYFPIYCLIPHSSLPLPMSNRMDWELYIVSSQKISAHHITLVSAKILLQFITIYWFENNYFSIFCHQTKKMIQSVV